MVTSMAAAWHALHLACLSVVETASVLLLAAFFLLAAFPACLAACYAAAHARAIAIVVLRLFCLHIQLSVTDHDHCVYSAVRRDTFIVSPSLSDLSA